MVNTEIFAQAALFGMTIKEVRVSHFPRGTANRLAARLRLSRKPFGS